MDTNVTVIGTEVSNADLDLMLADLDIEDAGDEVQAVTDIEPEQRAEAVIEEAEEIVVTEAEAEVEEQALLNIENEQPEEPTVSDEVADSIAADIEVEEQRDAVYAEAPADATDLDAKPEPAPVKKARAASSSTGGVARPRTELSALPDEAFVLTTDIPDDLAANKAAVIASCPAQKKVKEKFDNLLVSVAGGRKPSTYVCICFQTLQAAPDNEVTATQLVSAMKSAGLGEGTARSQSGQIMALFPALKIATRNGNKLTLNPDSMIAEALRTLLATA